MSLVFFCHRPLRLGDAPGAVSKKIDPQINAVRALGGDPGCHLSREIEPKVPTHTHLRHPDLYLKQDLPHACSSHIAESEASLNIEPQCALGSRDCLARWSLRKQDFKMEAH